MVIVQRIIRSKGSKSGKLVGKVHDLVSLDAVRRMAMQRRHVFSFLTEDGQEGTMRSGVKMRRVDAHVKNVVTTLSK